MCRRYNTTIHSIPLQSYLNSQLLEEQTKKTLANEIPGHPVDQITKTFNILRQQKDLRTVKTRPVSNKQIKFHQYRKRTAF